MFEYVAETEEGAFNHVHVVTSNLFNICEVFGGEDDALHYALQIFNGIDQTAALSYAEYMKEYADCHFTTLRAADLNCMVACTMRKKRIRRDKCYILGNE